jgi:hypothetical protein
MRRRKRTAILAVLAAGAVAIGAVATGAAPLGSGPALSDVPAANTKSAGFAPASKLSAELRQMAVAQGAAKLENGTSQVSYYGYDNDVANAAGEPQMLPTPAVSNEAHKTEPDKNTYLVFKRGLPGADPHYDYGTHFLFQGHEGGVPGNITRINLGADAAHRVTLLATADATGAPIADIDGSTWDPWARRLLFTTENAGAPTYAATPAYPSVVEDVSGALGRGGYEGIQDDGDGNIWIVEDIGGSSKPGTTARIPNSFVYRYVPRDPGDLAHGRLQVLQVLNAAGTPITQASQTAVNSPDQLAQHVYGSSFRTRWLTIHDTATDGTAPFSANKLAKAAKRHTVQAARERRLPPGHALRRVLLRRDRRHERHERRELECGRLGLGLPADAARSLGEQRPPVDLLQGRPGARGAGQHRVPLARHSGRRRGRGRHAALAAERARLRLRARRRGRLLGAGQPAAALARGGARCLRHDRLSLRRLRQERRRQRDHRSPRLGRRPVRARDPRCRGAEAVPRRLALVLHTAARRQPDLRSPSRWRGGARRPLVTPS